MPGGEPLNIDLSDLTQLAAPTATPGFRPNMNLATNFPVVDTSGAAMLPSENDPASVYYIKQQMTGYTGLGSSLAIDAYYVKTGPDTWEVSFFNSADATAGGFPYGSAGDAPLAAATLEFDPVTGALTSGSPLLVPLSNGDTFEIDYSEMVSLDENHPDWSDSLGTVRMNLNLSPLATAIEPYMIGATPAANQPNSAFNEKTSLTVYDNVGNELLLDIYLTKGPDNRWEITVFNQADASSNGSFPYASGPLSSGLVEFDPTTGKLIDGGMLTVPIPNGQDMSLDMAGMTELATGFVIGEADANGAGPANATGYSISDDGILYVEYGKNGRMAQYKIALATVQSPDQMTVLPGNVFQPGIDSGDVQIGFAIEGGLGKIVSGALENSNVDIAEELTSMIEAQRNYTANSKVFQTGSDLMDVLVNLKR